ncbi:MAG TPA: ubiquitin-like protein Pup [Acidimicrobiia bacterium]|nr:ubiquitin-like protein Pup [Acidimicrobiia bacterium]
MAEQERKRVRRDDATQTDKQAEELAAASTEDLTDRIDELLDEIDSVLEENAEEFVKNYVQKGGQ